VQNISLNHVPGDFNPFPSDELTAITLWSRFQWIVNTYPSRAAMVDDEQVFSYKDLMQRVDQVAARVANLKLPDDATVVVVLDTDWHSVVAMMALVKLGKIFLPVDTTLSDTRICSHIGTVEPALIVTNSHYRDLIASDSRVTTFFDIDSDSQAKRSDEITPVYNETVCQIFTSGSSGTPKRVIYTQKMILHDVCVRTNSLAISPSDRFAQWLGGTSLPLMTMFLALLNGACLILFDVRKQGLLELGRWIEQKGISVLRVTPSLFRSITAIEKIEGHLKMVRLVTTGGETLVKNDVELFRNCFPPTATLVNHLSATEYRVACQYMMDHQTLIQGSRIPVGFPLQGFRIDIVDKKGNMVADGATGEIRIKSEFISPGYVDSDTGKTILFEKTETGDIIFYSGDLGSVRPDGMLDHRGRKDRMVKIRGYRIELDEVESVVLSMEYVDQVCALVSEKNNGQLILAIAASEGDLPGIHQIRQKIYQELGLFGMPHSCKYVGSLPVTPNGKIDRKAIQLEWIENDV